MTPNPTPAPTYRIEWYGKLQVHHPIKPKESK